uniref:Zinc finger protein LEE1 n=1 Tax=Parastrongyloides trichosuri TaxID=131310 RepID=A0A0N4Z6V8_PARTI
MMYGSPNPIEGGYLLSQGVGGFSYPYGYLQAPPTMQFTNPPTIVSPFYYLPSLSPSVSISPPMRNVSPSPDNNLLITKNHVNNEEGSFNESLQDNDKNEKASLKKEQEDCREGTSSEKTKDDLNGTVLLTDRFAVKLLPNKYIHGVPATKWYSLSDEEREAHLQNQRRVIAYKTSLCVSFRISGNCSFGDKCRFAHGLDELKPPPERHPKYKTQLCDKFSSTGICPYGSRCQFIHATKTGEVVSDYNLYIKNRNKKEESDNHSDTTFGNSMSSGYKSYNRLNDKENPPKIINFSKSFAGSMCRKTIYENGTKMNKDNDNGQNILKILFPQNNTKESSKFDGSFDNKILNEPLFFDTQKNPKNLDDSKTTSDYIIQKLMEERKKYTNIEDNYYKNKDNLIKTSPEKIFPGSKSYAHGGWRKSFNRRNGYYTSSKVPEFIKFDNV